MREVCPQKAKYASFYRIFFWVISRAKLLHWNLQQTHQQTIVPLERHNNIPCEIICLTLFRESNTRTLKRMKMGTQEQLLIPKAFGCFIRSEPCSFIRYQSAENANVLGHCNQKKRQRGSEAGTGEGSAGELDARVSGGRLLFIVPARERCQPVTCTGMDLQC